MVAQSLPRTLQPPPELPGDDTLSDKLTQYLRTFSLWCRHGFADKLSISTAASRVLLQANDTTPPTPGPVYQLEVTSTPTLTLKRVSFGDGSLGPPLTLTMSTDLTAYMLKNGITNGSNAAAGQIGEYISALASVTLTTNVYTNVTSIILTPGDWDVSGRLYLVTTAGASNFQGGFTTTSGGLSQDLVFAGGTAVVGNIASAVPTKRYNVTVSTTIYLVGFIIFASGTANASGYLQARRMR